MDKFNNLLNFYNSLYFTVNFLQPLFRILFKQHYISLIILKRTIGRGLMVHQRILPFFALGNNLSFVYPAISLPFLIIISHLYFIAALKNASMFSVLTSGWILCAAARIYPPPSRTLSAKVFISASICAGVLLGNACCVS